MMIGRVGGERRDTADAINSILFAFGKHPFNAEREELSDLRKFLLTLTPDEISNFLYQLPVIITSAPIIASEILVDPMVIKSHGFTKPVKSIDEEGEGLQSPNVDPETFVFIPPSLRNCVFTQYLRYLNSLIITYNPTFRGDLVVTTTDEVAARRLHTNLSRRIQEMKEALSATTNKDMRQYLTFLDSTISPLSNSAWNTAGLEISYKYYINSIPYKTREIPKNTADYFILLWFLIRKCCDEIIVNPDFSNSREGKRLVSLARQTLSSPPFQAV